MATHSVTGYIGHPVTWGIARCVSGTLTRHRERFTGWRPWIRPVTG